ncbi:DUF6288 domain-containing protein [Haloferula sp. A504]|uniref:DUF6288 domain-containing protein n=1 Tax=Haloferula sp. A504 TaxID=3373601 RepID=UPI0031BFD930|nr:PDZ domain-containing protein [Verrucomicrobiaceae bacterium E54]
MNASIKTCFRILALSTVSLCLSMTMAKGDYYEEEPFFQPYPRANWQIKSFGPVGIGISIHNHQGEMSMKILNVEEGSPAAGTGQLESGQMIESINGVKLEKRDPRLILAELITDAEASDGVLRFAIRDKGLVRVTIPVMESYSPTWPLNCKKSDKIVRNLADRIAEVGEKEWGSVLFLLSTGEEKDLEVVRGWMKKRETVGSINWEIGYRGIGVCEYYLRTGDSSVLPMIQKAADDLRDRIYNGGWAGRGGSYTYQAGGHLNAAGVHCLTFLLLAKTCGVDVDEATLQGSLRHFYRFAGRGSVPYGDYTPKVGYGDCNGKTSGLALAMAAASRLTPDGHRSIYHKAAQISAMKSFYGINTYSVGHTGGGIGEIWKSSAMALMKDLRPEQYRAYLDERKWVMELSRRHTGSIGVGGASGDRYNEGAGENELAWGNYFALTYTLPRRKLFLFGAPSKYAKTHELPARPWGTAADDDFASAKPVRGENSALVNSPGPVHAVGDIAKEDPRQHAGKAVEELMKSDEVSDQDIVTYLHHPEIGHRNAAMYAALRLRKDHTIMGLLESEDARLQHMGIMALHEYLGTWRKNNMDPDRVTPAMWSRVEELIRDRETSWFVKQWALGVLAHADLDKLREFRDLLASLIVHEEHWIQGSAISTSKQLFADPQSYRTVFPPVAQALSKATAYPIVTRTGMITSQLKTEGTPEMREYAVEVLKPLYRDLPNEMVSERGIFVVPGGGGIKRANIASLIGFSEEGQHFLDAMPKITTKWVISGREEDKYVFGGEFQLNEELVGGWLPLRIRKEKIKSEEEAIKFIERYIKLRGLPSPESKDIGAGFRVKEGSEIINVYGGVSWRYGKTMKHSGNMAFKPFIDQAYHFKVLTVGGRRFLMIEENFELERNKDYVPVYELYVHVKG